MFLLSTPCTQYVYTCKYWPNQINGLPDYVGFVCCMSWIILKSVIVSSCPSITQLICLFSLFCKYLLFAPKIENKNQFSLITRKNLQQYKWFCLNEHIYKATLYQQSNPIRQNPPHYQVQDLNPRFVSLGSEVIFQCPTYIYS